MFLRKLLLPLCLVLLALGAHGVRRSFIRTFFVDGPPGAAPALAGQGLAAPPLPAAARVRVVLLDGLGRDEAARLPALDGLCKAGLDLVVDMGFPTVSLPVQHVLWTGLTQQQSGLLFRAKRLRPPAPGALPGRIPGSIAVAESHPDIVHSFPFSRTLPAPSTRDDDAAWRGAGFPAAARALAASDARLGFVHVLRIDEAGHRQGAHSAAYRDAADSADALLHSLLGEDRRVHKRGGSAWFVLADHGHLPGGGHGDAEDRVRLVRACIAGAPLLPPLPPGRRLHLVDLSRALFEVAGLPAPGVGRPLAVALASPDEGATLPRPAAGAWSIALLVLVLGLGLGLLAVPLAQWLPLWLPLSLAAVVLLRGLPTLSNPLVYPPLGRDMVLCGSPGLLLLAGTLLLGARRIAPWRLAAAQLALPVCAALAALVVCGGPQRLLGLSPTPPLVPLWTGAASLLLCLVASGALAAALPSLAAAARGPSDPSAPSGSGDITS